MTMENRAILPRLPLDGSLDLTYRCNNRCVHCWLRLPPDDSLAKEELSLDEIRHVVDQARAMGCQAWSLSGGEPMLRPDFGEIFDYITRKSLAYKLNSNGTLITPSIAQLLRRKGRKMIALYGATAEVHDRVTQHPGSFEATMRGFAYLQEAGAGFVVQIVPMQANYFQYDAMLALANSLSPQVRVGAAWLWLSASGCPARNRSIASQRLDPAAVLEVDKPSPMGEINHPSAAGITKAETDKRPDDRLFASCIDARRDFHIDPYGQMSFCYYVKDPALRYDLRNGTFQQAWDEFIPSLKDKVRGGSEYLENCGSCDLRSFCRWCAVYAYLEHGRYSAKIDYLCQVAKETKKLKDRWRTSFIQHYRVGGLVLQLSADFPLDEAKISSPYRRFCTKSPETDRVAIHLSADIPSLSDLKPGELVVEQPPWEIYQRPHAFTHVGSQPGQEKPQVIAIFGHDHSRTVIYSRIEENQRLELDTWFASPLTRDLLVELLAAREALVLRAGGLIADGRGFVIVADSEIRSTLLQQSQSVGGKILASEQIIVRRWPEGIRVHGFWGGDTAAMVSPADAPLQAIVYLQKAKAPLLTPIAAARDRAAGWLAQLIEPADASDEGKHLVLLREMAAAIPAYRLQFDSSDNAVQLFNRMIDEFDAVR